VGSVSLLNDKILIASTERCADTIKNVAKRNGLAMDAVTKRSPEAEPEEDADEAIAYAWFTEETEGTA